MQLAVLHVPNDNFRHYSRSYISCTHLSVLNFLSDVSFLLIRCKSWSFFFEGKWNHQHQYLTRRMPNLKNMFPYVLSFTFLPLPQKVIFLNSDKDTVCRLFVFHFDLRLDGEQHSGLPQFLFSLSWAPGKCCSLSHLLNLNLIILEWKMTLLLLTSPNIFSCELIKWFWFYFKFLLLLLFYFIYPQTNEIWTVRPWSFSFE